MPHWTRKKGDYLVKTAKMTDGELLHLIIGKFPNSDDDFDQKIYSSFQHVKASTGRAALWVFGTAAFSALSHFGVLKSASASGLEIAPAVFSHVALLSLSLLTMIFCFSYCKQTYLSSWFTFKIKKQPAASNARNLMLYPDAYWHFAFLPSNVGYPPHILGRRAGYGQLAYIGLVLIALVLFSFGSIALWLAIAADVWRSNVTSDSVKWLTLSLSAITTLLGWASPFYYDWSRRYGHYGLVHSLAKLDADKNKLAHQKMIFIARRMGLLDWPTNDQ